MGRFREDADSGNDTRFPPCLSDNPVGVCDRFRDGNLSAIYRIFTAYSNSGTHKRRFLREVRKRERNRKRAIVCIRGRSSAASNERGVFTLTARSGVCGFRLRKRFSLPETKPNRRCSEVKIFCLLIFYLFLMRPGIPISDSTRMPESP